MIVVVNVGRGEPFHCLAYRLAFLLYQEMHMIAHETIRIENTMSRLRI